MNRPPLPLRILYRLDIWVLGPRWREWVEEDVESPAFPVREAAGTGGALLMLAPCAAGSFRS